MVEIRTAQPYNTMDRQYHETIEVDPVSSHANIEEPIIPISELGQTIPERDPAGRFKNIIQTAQASMRAGAGKLQLMFNVPSESAIGGRPKAYGKEVREALRDVFAANEAILSGVEMPTSINNLSGYDPQRGTFDDEKMKRDMDEVKDAIKFASEVAQGGGVDIVSWEYARPLFNAEWNKKDKKGRQLFEEAGEPVVQVVDERTGRINMWRINQIERIPVARDPKTGKPYAFVHEIGRFAPIDKDKPYTTRSIGEGKYVVEQGGKEIPCVDRLQPWKWNDYKKWAEEESKKKGEKITPEEYFAKEQMQAQIKQARGWATTYKESAKRTYNDIQDLKEELEAADTVAKKREIEAKLYDAQKKYEQEVDTIQSYEQQAAENEQMANAYVPLGKYAMKRTVNSYAKLGVAARQETLYNKNIKSPLYVGPELGWPHAYGSHPEEFKELIEQSRQEMIKLLTDKKIPDPKNPDKWIENPHYEPGMSRREAEEAAKNHIKGCLDTSHMGMWLQHFKPELPWEKRVKEFNKWYMDEVKKLAKSDVVGSIQLVDSQSGAHGHLPPGQGIFPVVEAAKEFKKEGFKGFMVSEGHEEESFNEGRILVETWRAFNAPFESKYGPGMPPAQGFGDVHNRYQGRTYSPRMMFGSYVPPFGEYKPWSEIPFE